jgi:hypothetical protein
VRLTAASAPLWFRLSLIDEYGRRLERALQVLAAAPTPDAALEMRLNAMLGHALLYTRGPTPGMIAAINRALEIADLLGDTSAGLHPLWGLGMVHLMHGDYPSAVDVSERCRRASINADDWAANMSDRLSALAHHFAGDQATARCYAERVLDRPIKTKRSLSTDHQVAARAVLCCILWVQGFPDQALRAAHDSVEDGLTTDLALSHCYALLFACPVVLWAGDLPAATRLVAMLLDRAARHSLTFWHFWGRCFDTALELRHGDAAELGRRLELLRDPLCSAVHLEMLGTLSEELTSAEAIARAENGLAGWCAAEILRAKGEIVLKQRASDAVLAAETLFRRSLGMARQQKALSWELRAATSLARLWREQGRVRGAYDLLAPVYGRFTEGFGTADLVRARTLLDELLA